MKLELHKIEKGKVTFQLLDTVPLGYAEAIGNNTSFQGTSLIIYGFSFVAY